MKVKPKSELALAQAKAKGQVETVHRAPAAAAAQQANKIDNAEVGEYKAQTITLEFKSRDFLPHGLPCCRPGAPC